MATQQPLFQTESEWQPPDIGTLPDWTGAERIGIDTETYDPYLQQLGPSVRRGGYIVGISFAIEDGPAFYLPFRHEGGDNLPEQNVLHYIQAQASAYRGVLVGANLNYDLDYLAEIGIVFPNIAGQRDTQIADPLIDELQRSYSLDTIAERWQLPGKRETTLIAAARNYRVNPKRDLWRLPARYVGEYAEWDARLPLLLLRKQERKIDELELWDVYNLECELQPAVLKMQRHGVRIDTDALERVRTWSLEQEQQCLDRIYTSTGVRIEIDGVHKKPALVRALTSVGITLSRTATGQHQIDKELLSNCEHPVAKDILQARKVNKLRTTFVQSIEDHMVNGRIHCTFNQLRRTKESGDTKGPRFGRMSSDHPNLQQQPSRDEFASMWRSIYVPDTPEQQWLCADYSQQEPRMLTHFAEMCKLRGAKYVADRYRTDPTMDNHQMMADLCGIDRRPAKNIFLGLCYGMGGAKLARELGLPTKWIQNRRGDMVEVAGDEAQALLDRFDANVPFVRRLARRCADTAAKRGWIKTISGRRCHFPKGADGTYDWTHKAINRLIQGSSADQTKRAIIEVVRAGLPLQLQIHDELDTGIDDISQAKRIAQIMQDCLPLRVPSKVDIKIGPSWGEVKLYGKEG